MITTIKPRMRRALDDGKRIVHFAEIWASVLNDAVDLQVDFDASAERSDVDFTFNPNFARLATEQGAYDIEQLSHNSNLVGSSGPSDTIMEYGIQSFVVRPARELKSITIRVDNSAAGRNSTVVMRLFKATRSEMQVYYGNIGNLAFAVLPGYMLMRTQTVDMFFNGDITWTFDPPVPMAEGEYQLLVYSQYGRLRYQNTNVFGDGHMGILTVEGPGSFNSYKCSYLGIYSDIGDMYFKVELSGFKPSGHFKTRVMDLGEVPSRSGVFQMISEIPDGTGVSVSLQASTSRDMSSPLVISDPEDSADLPPGYRYWQAEIWLFSDESLSLSPLIDLVEVMFPKDRIMLREQYPLHYVNDELRTDWMPLLSDISFDPVSIEPTDRISKIGDASCSLIDPTGDSIQRMVSNWPLKNYRAILYAGVDVPGFSENDLLRIFTGIVSVVDPRPGYREAPSRLALTFNNSLFELTTKVPRPLQTGLVDVSVISIDHDAKHVMDSMIDLLRGHAAIPARYINLPSFRAAKAVIGDGFPAPEAYVVRRSDAAGLPDTRIKNPVELRKLLSELLIIADGYLTIDEHTRLTFVKHDVSASPEADWADEDMVRDGLDAVPIERVDSYDLGYADRIFNAALMGCAWDGAGDAWDNFTLYANVDAEATAIWSPGLSSYMRIMEGNHIGASKWLGPEEGYQGESIAQSLVARFVDRHSYPPVIMRGVATPLSQYVRTAGDVVRLWSKRFVKFGRRGIATSENKTFMVLSKKHDRPQNRMIFDLMEIT